MSNIHVKYYFSKQRKNKEEVVSKDVQTKTQKTPENENSRKIQASLHHDSRYRLLFPCFDHL